MTIQNLHLCLSLNIEGLGYGYEGLDAQTTVPIAKSYGWEH